MKIYISIKVSRMKIYKSIKVSRIGNTSLTC